MNQLTQSILYFLFVENQNQNWVFSPASYLEAMSNLSECLKGRNLAELLEAAPDIKSEQASGLDAYNTLLYSQEYAEVLNQAVVQTLKERGTNLESFDGPGVIDRVNQIVREKTHGKIDNFLSPNDLTEFTKFIILNCVYFKSKWTHAFTEKWVTEKFFGTEGEAAVKFLHSKTSAGTQRYYEDDKVDIAELQ